MHFRCNTGSAVRHRHLDSRRSIAGRNIEPALRPPVPLARTLRAVRFGALGLLRPAFAGVNLLESGVTGSCPPTWLLRKLGWVDAQDVIHWGGRRR